jgi:hypothetical protein
MTDAGGHRHAFDPGPLWADGVITPAEGFRFVADLGFELVHGDRPDRPGGANLIVALRAEPTERHFDTERIEYWSSEHGRGVRRQLERSVEPPEHLVAWGTITVFDRLKVSNAFFTFGGTIRLADTDAATRIVVIGSPAPIMRCGGHSQGKDVRADEVGAFFARLRAAVGGDMALEARVLAAAPMVLYAALIASVRDRIGVHRALGDARPGYDAWSLEEMRHLEATGRADLDAGRALLAAVGIVPG